MKKKINKKMEIVFLLDRSGSMGCCVRDTILGYNSYLNSQRKNDALITTVLFDDEYELLHNRIDINKVKKITNREYYVRGCTALYDAIGKTINMIDKNTSNSKVLFIIITDGLENASVEYNKKTIQKLIKNHSNWEFIYLGANIDSYEEGSSIGINKKNISNYGTSSKGLKAMFRGIGEISDCYCEGISIPDNWQEDIEKEISN